MKIHAHLYGSLRDLLPAEQKGRATLELPAGTTPADVLTQLGIDSFALIAINDEHDADHNQPLQDGDKLAVFMPAAGG